MFNKPKPGTIVRWVAGTDGADEHIIRNGDIGVVLEPIPDQLPEYFNVHWFTTPYGDEYFAAPGEIAPVEVDDVQGR